MVFLNPAVLFGLLASSIPIIIHLLNLRKLKKIEFSTLIFLKELQKNKIKKVKIKQWILLLLRTLLIIFLVLSFARPSIKAGFGNTNSSAAKTTAVIILDNTFSMSVITDKGSYFNLAKFYAKQILDKLKEGDEAVIIPVASLNNNFTVITDLNKVKKDLDNVQISDVSKTLHQAVTKAAKIIEKSDNFNKEVYILSDFQQKRLYEDNKELSDFSEIFKEHVRIYSMFLNGKSAADLSVDLIEPTNQLFNVGKNIGFNVTVTNSGDLPVSNSVLSLFINSERVAQQNVSLMPNETKIIHFETVLKNKGLNQIVAECEDDAVLNNNKRYFSLFVPDEVKVLIITDNEKDNFYINAALTGKDTLNNIRVTQKNSTLADAINYNDFNAVVLIGGNNIKNFNALNDFIQNKGGVIIFPSSNSNLGSFNNVLKSLNLPAASESKGIKNNSNGYNFGNIDFNHPIFFDLFEKNQKPTISTPEIYTYYKLTTGLYGRSIIEMDDKSPFLAEYSTNVNKVLVFNTAPNLEWANFIIKGIFAPLINRSINYLTYNADKTLDIFAGKTIYFNIGKNIAGALELQKNKDITEKILTDSLKLNGILEYSNTDMCGIYKIYNNNKLITFRSVNFDPIESKLKYDNLSNFEEYLKKINFKGNLINLNSDEDILAKIYQSRFGTELWRLFLILAIITALLEIAVAKSAKKDLINLE